MTPPPHHLRLIRLLSSRFDILQTIARLRDTPVFNVIFGGMGEEGGICTFARPQVVCVVVVVVVMVVGMVMEVQSCMPAFTYETEID